MKNPYKIPLSQVARAAHALDLTTSVLLEDDPGPMDGNLAKIAEYVIGENNDKSRKVMKSFIRRYNKQITSTLINLKKEEVVEFPAHILKTAKNLLKLSKDPAEINESSWRNVCSLFGDLCELEQISKRSVANRRKMFNAWNSKDGILRACFDSLIRERLIQDDDQDYPMESCSSCTSSEPDSEEEIIGRKTHPVGFRGCVIKVGNMKVEKPLLTLMEESRPSMNLCVKEMIETLSKGCVVNVNRVNINEGESPRVTGYAYCSHHACRLYKFKIHLSHSPKTPATFELFADKVSLHHKGKLTRSLKGMERCLEKTILQNEHPYTQRLNAANDCNSDLAFRGNLQSVRSASVFRKVRSEVLAKDDLHKDDILDIMKMMEQPEYATYIQSVGKPFHAYLWSTNMHKVAQKVCKKGPPHNYLHFDATGSVVKKQGGKQVYLYGGGFTWGGEIYPAFDFLLSAHKTDDIMLPLISYRRSVLDTTNRWPLFPLVVMDDSMAMRSALSLAWNLMPLHQYIEHAYQWMKDGAAPSDMVVLMGCNSHFSKRVCQGASKFAEKGSTLRKFMVESVIALCQSKDFDSIMQALRHLIIIFNSQFRTKLLRLSLQALQTTIVNNKVKEEEFEPLGEENEDDEKLWEGSPLAIHLKEIERQELQHLKAEKDGSVELNPFYSPPWYKYMAKTFAPKLVFNTAIFLPEGRVSISNQLQENSHRILKVVILKNQRKKKPGRFIRLQRKRVFGLIKLHDLRIGKKPTTKSKSLTCYEEKFKKRLRNKTAHTSLKAVKKIDLALISAKKVKNKIVKATMTTRKRATSPWKFEILDEAESGPTISKPAVSQTKKQKLTQSNSGATNTSPSSPHKTVEDLLASFGTKDFPPAWESTDRALKNSVVIKSTLQRVVENKWLDDEAINAFLHTRLSRTPNHLRQFLLFNSFHTGYSESGLCVSAQRFVQTVKPLNFDVWLIPVNVENCHWAMFVVLPQQRIVLYLDSMNFSAHGHFKSVMSIVQFTLQQDGLEASLGDWVGLRCTDLTQQANGSDCGVFMCLFAQVVVSGEALNLRPGDGKVARKWLAWELCNAEEPEATVHHPWAKIGKLAKVDLPESKMLIKSWENETPSMQILAQILSRSNDINFRDDIV